MLARMRSPRRRKGALALEAAIVYVVLLSLVMGGVVAGLGLFRSQEVAHMARVSARWASLQAPEGRTGTLLKARLAALPPFGVDPDPATIGSPKTSGDVVSVSIPLPWTPEALFAPKGLGRTAGARVPD